MPSGPQVGLVQVPHLERLTLGLGQRKEAELAPARTELMTQTGGTRRGPFASDGQGSEIRAVK